MDYIMDRPAPSEDHSEWTDGDMLFIILNKLVFTERILPQRCANCLSLFELSETEFEGEVGLLIDDKNVVSFLVDTDEGIVVLERISELMEKVIVPVWEEDDDEDDYKQSFDGA